MFTHFVSKFFSLYLSFLVFCLHFPLLVFADVPRTTSYQGVLKDQNGIALPGPVDLHIRIYDDATSGNVLYDEEHPDVSLNNGVYSIQIGSGFIPGTSTPTDGLSDQLVRASQLWLGVTVDDGNELNPRTSLTSVLFALKSKFAEELIVEGTTTPSLSVTQGGNIGIGISNPGSKLHVDGIITDNRGNSSNWNSAFEWGNHASQGYITPKSSAALTNKSGNISMWTNDSGYLTGFNESDPQVASNSSNRVPKWNGSSLIDGTIIDRSGNIGIGESNPVDKLHVTHDNSVTQRIALFEAPTPGNRFIRVQTETAAMHLGVNNSPPDGYIWSSSNRVSIGGTIPTVYVNGMENGSVGIGIGATTPNAKLQVAGSVNCNGGTCSSDLRWKKNIEPLRDGLAKVTRLQGVQYDWRTEEFEEKNFEDEQQIGFIAQEVEEVVPELVRTDTKGFKSLDYARMTTLLVEAVKELDVNHKARLEQLETENKELRTRLAALEQQLSTNHSF